MKILCIGHAAYDITLPVDSYPLENKKIRLSHEKVECGGGPAATAAYLLAKWQVPTSFAGVVGNDTYGLKIAKEFEEIGVSLKYLQMLDHVRTTSSYIIANLSNGTRTILTSKDPSNDLKDLEIKEEFSYILVDGDNFNLSKKVLLEQKQAISMIDAGKNTKDIVELSHLVSYLVCSNDFARDYTNLKLDYHDLNSIKKVYAALEKDFPKQTIIITLESFGSFTKINGEYKLIPSIKVKALDSTGAGDIYHGALLYFLSQGYDLETAMEYANITSALSVTKIGGRYSIPRLEEVINYVK